MTDPRRHFELLVIGGGCAGLAALFHAHRLGARRLALIEQFRLGHERGSSHGMSRVTRTTYSDPAFVSLMRQAHASEWPRLEAELGAPLIHRHGGVFHGQGERFAAYRRAVSGATEVEELTTEEARRRFSQFRFPDADAVLHDHSAGVVDARATMQELARVARQQAELLLENTRVERLEFDAAGVVARTSWGDVHAERAVVAAGAWLKRLAPELGSVVQVARQTVGYFQLAGDPADFSPRRFPVWCWIGERQNEFYYGLPEFGRPGIKLARHITAGVDDDPDESPATAEAKILDLEQFVGRHFTAPIVQRAGSEHCLYTNTVDEDFVIDWLDEHRRVVVGSACSGHGFKFTPLTGRLLAELALLGRSEVQAFTANQARFSIARHLASAAAGV